MRLSRDAAQRLAAEYVVGTLRGRARRRFEALARADADLRAAIERWENELTPLADRIAPVEPPERVWKGIETRLWGEAPKVEKASDFFRSLGMIATGLAVVLVVALLWLEPAREAEPAMVAVLTASDSVPRMVVSLDTHGELKARMVKPWANVEGKSLELWVLPANGAPKSLGLVSNSGDTRLRVATSDAAIHNGRAFAVSLEPRGGSPTGQPTGPVLCSGVIAATRKT